MGLLSPGGYHGYAMIGLDYGRQGAAREQQYVGDAGLDPATGSAVQVSGPVPGVIFGEVPAGHVTGTHVGPHGPEAPLFGGGAPAAGRHEAMTRTARARMRCMSERLAQLCARVSHEVHVGAGCRVACGA